MKYVSLHGRDVSGQPDGNKGVTRVQQGSNKVCIPVPRCRREAVCMYTRLLIYYSFMVANDLN